MRILLRLAASVIGACCLAGAVAAQGTGGQKIQAKPGDLILVENADKVRIVRRREAQIRAIYNGPQRSLLILVDYAAPGGEPDGRVDVSLGYEDVTGDWPLGDRWEGRVVIDDYSLAGETSPHGIGFSSPAGLIQVLGRGDGTIFRDPSALATLVFNRLGRSTRGLSFDVAEQQELGRLVNRTAAPSTGGFAATGTQPIRVGGAIKTPVKVRDVRPVYPEDAMRAGITGMVILEAVIGVDGAVTDARVLKSIPVLDAAAIDAVRQWRFEPTLLNGMPVPVIMTVTVNFNLQ